MLAFLTLTVLIFSDHAKSKPKVNPEIHCGAYSQTEGRAELSSLTGCAMFN